MLLASTGAFYSLRWEWGQGPSLCAAAAAALIVLRTQRRPAGWTAVAGLILVSAASAGWTRVYGLFLGHPPFAAALFLTAFALGAAAEPWLRARVIRSAGGSKHAVTHWALSAAGFWGLFSLAFLRFIGLNAGSAERLQSALLSSRDALFIALQLFALAAIWSVLVVKTNPDDAEDKAAAAAMSSMLLCVLLGPAAGYLFSLLGAASALAAANAALLALGLWHALRAGAPASDAIIKAASAAVAAGLWLSMAGADLFKVLWTNRLDAAYPGGRFLLLEDDGREILGVYQFSTKAKTLLSDGFVSLYSEDGGKHAAHILLLLRPQSRRMLALGARHPATLHSALSHGISLDAVDPHKSYSKALQLLSRSDAIRKDFSVSENSFTGYLSSPGPEYDVILQEIPYPHKRPENASRVSRQALGLLRRRLKPGGIAAIRLPGGESDPKRERMQAAIAGAFTHAGLCRFDDGVLILVSDSDFSENLKSLRARITDNIWIDDPRLDPDLAAPDRCADMPPPARF